MTKGKKNLLIITIATLVSAAFLSYTQDAPSPLSRVIQLYNEGKFSQANEQWNLLLLKEPSYIKSLIADNLRRKNTKKACELAELLQKNKELLHSDPSWNTLCADAYIQNGDTSRGLKLLENTLKIFPGNIDARLMIAREALNNEDYSKAETALSGSFPPSSTRAMVARSRLSMSRGKFKEAAQMLTVAVNIDGSNVEARYYLILALTELNEFEEATKMIEETRALVPNNNALELAHIELQLKQGEEHTNDMLSRLNALSETKDKNLSIKATELKITILEKKERFTEALEMAQKVAKVSSTEKLRSRWLIKASDLAMAIGREYEKKKAHNRADTAYSHSIALLQEAYKKTGINHRASAILSARYIELGEHYFAKAKNTTSSSLKSQLLGYAIFNLERAAELSKGKVGKAHHILGQILNHLNRHDEAIEHFKIVKNNLSGFVESIYTYGESCLRVSKFLDALTAFKEVLAVQPENWKAHRDMGLTYWNLKNRTKAEYHFKQALNYEKSDPVAWYYLGKIRRGQRRYSDAMLCYTKVQTLTTGSSESLYNEMEIEARHQLQDIPLQKQADRKLKALGGTPREDETRR